MRIEVITEPFEYCVKLILSETERRELVSGTQGEARSWKQDVRIARAEIRQYLCYYDTQRCHSSLNYLTPCKFERGQE
jgi:transposase InsO family protein